MPAKQIEALEEVVGSQKELVDRLESLLALKDSVAERHLSIISTYEDMAELMKELLDNPDITDQQKVMSISKIVNMSVNRGGNE